MSDDKLNRREFLERAAAIGAAAVGAGTLLSACDPPEQDTEEQAADDFSCNDDAALADLSEDEIAQRESHDYVDDSPVEGEYCDNCIFWQPAEAGEDCGGCDILPGPYHPDGWCDQWQAAG